MKKINKTGRNFLQIILTPLVWLFVVCKIPPNLISIIGLILSAVTAYVFSLGHIRLGGIGILVAGVFDAIDGIVARKRGIVSKSGAFWDSVLDRYSDLIVLFGITYYSFLTADTLLLFATLLIILGSVAVPYIRAKSESLGIECSVGFMPRHFRIIILALGAIIGGEVFRWFVVALAVLTNITAIHRIVHSYKKLRSK